MKITANEQDFVFSAEYFPARFQGGDSSNPMVRPAHVELYCHFGSQWCQSLVLLNPGTEEDWDRRPVIEQVKGIGERLKQTSFWSPELEKALDYPKLASLVESVIPKKRK